MGPSSPCALAEATACKTIAVFDNHILLGPASEAPNLRGWQTAVIRERFDPSWAPDAAIIAAFEH